MSCSTCERRQTLCDESRPRCSTCTRVHLRCVYSGPPKNFLFQDETQLVIGQTSTSKRRKISAVDEVMQARPSSTGPPPPLTAMERDQQSISQLGIDVEQDWATSYDMMPNPDFAAWEHDLYADLMANTSPGQLLSHAGVTPDSLDFNVSYLAANDPNAPSLLENKNPNVRSDSRTEPTKADGNRSGHGTEDSSEVPKHVLAQHYSLSAVHRPDSKSWNFYMHFYNRFATTHPPVLLAIYAFASAQLLYANKIGSMASAISYYNSSLAKIESLYGIILPETSGSFTKESLVASLGNLKKEGLDVVIVSFYFLALFDLMTTRPVQLRRILRVMPLIIRARKQDELSGTFQRLSTWFLFLDTRASLFGLGDHDSLIYSIGDEEELAAAVNASKNVLREEYSILYPEEECIRDKFSVPLILRILEIMVIFREISRHTEQSDDNIKARIMEKINLQSKGLEAADEQFAKEKKILNYYYTIVALYSAVEIYYSRVFYPALPLYSANHHAVTILTMTEKMHRTLKVPRAATPHSKSWPIPLILAAIEVKDPIHRDWALRKFHDYRRAGNHYVKSCSFAERICELEESVGSRVNLGHVMKGMGEEFIV